MQSNASKVGAAFHFARLLFLCPWGAYNTAEDRSGVECARRCRAAIGRSWSPRPHRRFLSPFGKGGAGRIMCRRPPGPFARTGIQIPWALAANGCIIEPGTTGLEAERRPEIRDSVSAPPPLPRPDHTRREIFAAPNTAKAAKRCTSGN